MNSGKALGAAMIVVSLVGLGVAAPAMARRLGARENHVVFFGKPIAEASFAFRGEPLSIVTADKAASPEGAGGRSLEIRWRGATHEVPIEAGMREDDRLPGLLRHDDWLRVLTFAEGGRSEHEVAALVASGEVRPRLVVAMRFPPTGFDPGSWGSVRRREWRYRFVELMPADSGPEPFAVVESTYRELERLGDPSARKAAGREADAWQYAAMEQVTPPTLLRSKNRNMDEAMTSMGWTWPVAGASIMGVLAGIGVMVIAGGRRGEG